MIRLTRLNNRPLVVNSDLIKFIENAPDTVITLISGEKIVVLESAQEVISKIVEFRRRLRRPLMTAMPSEDSNALANGSREPENPEGLKDRSEADD
jgi:flagellar protein FlbD